MTTNISDRFERIGDDYGDVENVSGYRWPYSEMIPRPGIAQPPPGPRVVSHRRQVEIDARSGERLDAETGRALSAAQRRLNIAETVDQSHPSARPMLRHIFGLNLGRDRA
jgi:hypothetical protein